MNRNFTLVACVATLVGLFTAASSQAGFPLSRINNLTFSHAVSLPGVILPAGTYAFETAPIDTDSNIVRVSTLNRRKLLYRGFTVPVGRPSGSGAGRLLEWGEAPAGEPTPIAVWYPMGSDSGHGFRYRR